MISFIFPISSQAVNAVKEPFPAGGDSVPVTITKSGGLSCLQSCSIPTRSPQSMWGAPGQSFPPAWVSLTSWTQLHSWLPPDRDPILYLLGQGSPAAAPCSRHSRACPCPATSRALSERAYGGRGWTPGNGMEEENAVAGTSQWDQFPTSSRGIWTGDLLPSAHTGSHPHTSPSPGQTCAASQR